MNPLAAFTLGERAATVALVVIIWLAPAAATWLWMQAKASAQYNAGVAACENKQANELAAALDAAQRKQATLLLDAKADSAAIKDALAASRTRAEKLAKDLAAYAQANPLPAGCRADDTRVRLYNDARRTAAP
jgi:Skp family chaperone for outer membrane proteins